MQLFGICSVYHLGSNVNHSELHCISFGTLQYIIGTSQYTFLGLITYHLSYMVYHLGLHSMKT